MTEKTLNHLKPKETAKIKKFNGGIEFLSKIRTMGLREGKQVTVVAREPARGPVVVRVGNTTLTVGRGMAEKIIVE